MCLWYDATWDWTSVSWTIGKHCHNYAMRSWYNGYRWRKWTRWPEFKSWTRSPKVKEKKWRDWKSEEKSRPSRPQYNWLEYLEESWMPGDICCHSDSSERLPAKTCVKNPQIMIITMIADPRMKLKSWKERQVFTPCQRTKKAVENKGDGDTYCYWRTSNGPKSRKKELE